MATLTPSPKMQFLDANGNPLVGGKLYTYSAGTTTPLATYTDSGAGTPNTNPIILDSRGEASVWLGSTLYYMELKSSTDVLIWTSDNIGGVATLSALAESGGSALIGFIQTGSGAVTRTSQAKLRDVVSVKDFGAVGNGVADDGPAWNLALAAAKCVNGVKGEIYNIATSIAGTYVGRKLEGNGSTLTTSAISNFNVIYFDSTCSDNEVSGFTVQGTATTDTATPVIGVYCYQSSRNYIHGNTFTGLNYGVCILDVTPVAATNPVQNRITNNLFKDAIGPTNGGYGVLNVRAKGTTIIGNSFGNANVTAGLIGRHCVYISAGSSECVVSNNFMSSCVLSPISFNSGTVTADAVFRNIVADNIVSCSGLTTAFSYGIALTGQCINNIFSGNEISNSCNSGIFMQSADATHFPSNNIVTGNRILASGTNSIDTYDITGTLISGNVITGSNVQGTANQDIRLGIALTAGTSGNCVIGNRIGSPVNSLRNNISFAAGSSGNVATGNVIDSATQVPVNDVTGNNFINTNNGGTQTVTYAATVTPDPALGEIIKITLTGNITIANVAWAVNNQKITFVLTQDGTGGRTVTWGSLYDTNITWSDTGNVLNTVSTVSLVYDGAKWRQIGAQVAWHN